MSSLKKLKIGVVGATGMVGQSFIRTLEDKKFPVESLRPFASENSIGKKIKLQGQSYDIEVLKPGCFAGLDLVFFSSGDDISAEWAPQAVAAGAWAVDNSNAFRMNADTLLVVPEVNGDLLANSAKPQVIANPNCSVIQLAVALRPLQEQFGIESVITSTYQSVSGAGQAAYDELLATTEVVMQNAKPALESKRPEKSVFPHSIAFNCIPEIGSYKGNGYFSEDLKVIQETKKILGDSSIRVSAMTVRVPVLLSHACSVWVRLKKKVSLEQVQSALKAFPGIVLQDDPSRSVYPLQTQAAGQDPVYVGRVHQDLDDPQMWIMWVVSDNIRKGAALNGIQIAERIFDIPARA